MARSSDSRRQRRRALTWSLILILARLVVSFRLVEQIGPERQPSDRFVVTRILDGDTVELQGGDKLRLLAIDTPERGEPLYEEATQLLAKLTLGREATIEFGNRRRDRYGRLLGFLYIDTLLINKVIIENGLGYLYLFKDTDLKSPQVTEMLKAQQKAVGAAVGLFALQRMPESHYIAKQGAFRFHRPSCRSVDDLVPGTYRLFERREEALAEGLSPCRNCKP